MSSRCRDERSRPASLSTIRGCALEESRALGSCARSIHQRKRRLARGKTRCRRGVVGLGGGAHRLGTEAPDGIAADEERAREGCHDAGRSASATARRPNLPSAHAGRGARRCEVQRPTLRKLHREKSLHSWASPRGVNPFVYVLSSPLGQVKSLFGRLGVGTLTPEHMSGSTSPHCIRPDLAAMSQSRQKATADD